MRNDPDKTYQTRTTDITIVEGVQVDITVRTDDGYERRGDKVLMDLKERLGLLGAAFDAETPPADIDDVPEEYVPPMSVAWGRVFDEEDADD